MKRNLVFVNKDVYQTETLTKWPVRLPLNMIKRLKQDEVGHFEWFKPCYPFIFLNTTFFNDTYKATGAEKNMTINMKVYN